MTSRDFRTERSGVAMVEEKSLRVVPESAEVQSARIIASLRGDTTPQTLDRLEVVPSSRAVSSTAIARRERAAG